LEGILVWDFIGVPLIIFRDAYARFLQQPRLDLAFWVADPYLLLYEFPPGC
jgi:hypothetical protein